MKVKAKAPFYDINSGVDRAFGEIFECTEERFGELNSTQFGTLAERIDEPAKKPARRSKAKASEGE
jgi:hypothetical protein